MQTAILNLIPAAAVAAPARGIGSAARAGGPGDADAAAGAFAGLLAAVAPAMPTEAPEGSADAASETETAAMSLVAAAALNVDDPAPAVAEVDAAAMGAAGSLPAVDAPTELPVADNAFPGAASTTTAPATPAAPAVPESLVSVETAAPLAAIPVTTTETATPAATTTVLDVPAPVPGSVAAPEAPAVGATAGAAAGPSGATDPAAATTSTGPTAAVIPAADPSPQAEAGAPTSAALPNAATDATARIAAELPNGTPATVVDQPVVIVAASEAAEPALPQPAIGPGPDAAAPEAREAGSGFRSDDETAEANESTADSEGTADNETAEGQDLPAPADAKPAALQALLGLGLQTYLKAEALAGPRPPVMSAADPATAGSTGDARTEGQVMTGRPAAFAAAVDSALAGLAGGGDSTSEDALMALTGAGRTRTARGADAASTIRSQVAEQVARGLASGRGEDKLTIRLNPESLGRVDVDFSSTGDRLTVVMRASTPEAEQALRAGARELTDGILERAARYQHVEVRVELRDGTATRAGRQDERQQEERHDGRQDKGQDGKQDGRRDGRADGRGRQPDGMFDGAKSAWARAMADLTQEG